MVLLQDDRFGAAIRRGALAVHTRLQRTAERIRHSDSPRPPIIRVAFGGDVRVAKLPVGRRQTGNNHSNISNRSAGAVGRTGRNACPPPKLLQFAQPDVAVADWMIVVL